MYGVLVPTPARPCESITKAVEVAVAVEVETVKSGTLPGLVEEAATERIAHGVEVPTPSLPFIVPAASWTMRAFAERPRAGKAAVVPPNWRRLKSVSA